jgi:3-isopropylmalate/(R)-2-methylmalate dehydratase large subunit
MNIVEKILARASGRAFVEPGDFVIAHVDTAVFIDSCFYPGLWREILKVENPDKIVVVFDHRAPAPDRTCAQMHLQGRQFVKRFGITRFHDVGRDQGISHAIAAEYGYALPGTVLVNSDSHTCALGALNCLALGVGQTDLVYAAAKGATWFKVAETIRYDLSGELRPGVSAKDVFLHLAASYGSHLDRNIEYGGTALEALSIDARRTLATMGAELHAEFSIFEPDQVLFDYLAERSTGVYTPVFPDAAAVYADRRAIELGSIEPMLAFPDAIVENAFPLLQGIGQPIDQAFVGSCANGNLEDLRTAAEVVRGRRVSHGVRFIVTPASQSIYRHAVERGYVAALCEAGAVVTNSSCGACTGGHLGVLGPGETCITASTRNFKGRMGDPTARIFVASPATVAASALTGRITDPREFIA